MIAFKFFSAEDVAKIDKAFPEDVRKLRQEAAAYQLRMESMLERIKARKARKAMFKEMCEQVDAEMLFDGIEKHLISTREVFELRADGWTVAAYARKTAESKPLAYVDYAAGHSDWRWWAANQSGYAPTLTAAMDIAAETVRGTGLVVDSALKGNLPEFRLDPNQSWTAALEKARASRAVFVQEVMGVFREDEDGGKSE